MNRIGGRKIVIMLITLAVGVGVTLLKGDVPQGLSTLLQVIFGAFILGNGVEHVTATRRQSAAVSSPPPAGDSLSDHTDAVNAVMTAVNTHTSQVEALSERVQSLGDTQSKLMGVLAQVVKKS